MPLPKDASIEEVAAVFGVYTRGLTPAARELTKGDMVKLWGVRNDLEALRAYQKSLGKKETLVKSSAKKAQGLSVDDLHSIERVFGSPVVPAERFLIGTGHKMRAKEMPDIYACCCPCCCATSVLEPLRESAV